MHYLSEGVGWPSLRELVVKLGRWVAKSEREVAKLGGLGGWVAKVWREMGG
jgi:hypothetical protein